MRRRLMLEELDARLVPTIYYVAPTGSDVATGDTAHPWKTLQHAADTVAAGDQVIIRAGNYVGFNLTTDGTATSRIAFTAEPGVTINTPNASGPHAGKDGINIEGADYVTIDGFQIVSMPRAGIRCVTNTNAVLVNNVCDDNVYWGILTGFAENVRIENNVCSRSHLQHGIYVSNSADNPIVRGNTVWGNGACGIHMNSDLSSGGDGVITGALIENNVIYNNGAPYGGSGINMDGVSNSRVQNNLLYNNHAGGIALYCIDGAHGAQNNVVANNTVLQASDGRWALLITDASTGNTVFNNVLMSNHSFRGSMDVSPDSLNGLKSDYNVTMSRFTLDDGTSVLTLAQWRTQTGQDAHTLVSTTNALFADVAGNDYHLAAASPALNAGIATLNAKAAPVTDMTGAGRPSGGGYDAGSYETQVGSGGNPPTANPDSYSILHDRTLSVSAAGVLANDTSNPSGRTLTAALVTAPVHGAVTLSSDGSFTYTPAAGYVGADAFTYTANDGTLVSNPATVSLSVTDQAPVAIDDSYTVGKNRTLIINGTGVLTNDTDPDGDALTAVLGAGPANGTLTLNANGSFTYTPNTGFTGSDSFTYRARDRALLSTPATVSVTVTNAAPVANANSYTVGRGRTLTVPAAGVLTNDSDADGDALTAILASGPANGTLSLNANGSFTYAPNAGFSGTDSFTYEANDGTVDSAAATVSIIVTNAPAVKSVVFNDGSAQRSLIRSITVTFDTLVTLDTGAFRLARNGGGSPSITRTMSQVNGETVVVLTFSGSGTAYRSLTDGNWTLTVFGTRVHRADDRAVIMGANYSTGFHRLFGDSDGDRYVDATDQAAFNAAFGQTDAASLATFDFDRDGDVDAMDRNRFNKRFGTAI